MCAHPRRADSVGLRKAILDAQDDIKEIACDVLVVGAGVAGTAAAVAAAEAAFVALTFGVAAAEQRLRYS